MNRKTAHSNQAAVRVVAVVPAATIEPQWRTAILNELGLSLLPSPSLTVALAFPVSDIYFSVAAPLRPNPPHAEHPRRRCFGPSHVSPYQGHQWRFAPVAGALAVVLPGESMRWLLPLYTDIVKSALGGYVLQYLPLFLLGALFGRLMADFGCGQHAGALDRAHAGRAVTLCLYRGAGLCVAY